MALPLSKQGKVNGERRVFQDKINGHIRAAQISISSTQENPMCLVCSETVAVTKEPETAQWAAY